MSRLPCWLLTAGLLMGCPSSKPGSTSVPTDSATTTATPAAETAAAATSSPAKGIVRSEPARDERLQIQLEILPDVKIDRIPMRTARLRFRNIGRDPVRIYLAVSEPFRCNISTLSFAPPSGAPLTVPEPRPHGYVVTERDFHLIEPGKELTFTQPFTIDPFARRGRNTERRPGFERGSQVAVRWTYENSITRWEGGVETFDGPTKPLFDGKDIPWIWTGKLSVKLTWIVPD